MWHKARKSYQVCLCFGQMYFGYDSHWSSITSLILFTDLFKPWAPHEQRKYSSDWDLGYLESPGYSVILWHPDSACTKEQGFTSFLSFSASWARLGQIHLDIVFGYDKYKKSLMKFHFLSLFLYKGTKNYHKIKISPYWWGQDYINLIFYHKWKAIY